MDLKKLAANLFNAIDNKDVDGFLSYMTSNITFRFGNAEPVLGKDNVGQAVSGFFESIGGLSHELTEIVEKDDRLVCFGFVTYARHDSSTLRVPFADIFLMQGDLIESYLIFIDTSELYQKTIAD